MDRCSIGLGAGYHVAGGWQGAKPVSKIHHDVPNLGRNEMK